MVNDEASKQMILDTALRLAETRHWESLRFHEVSEATGLSLNRIRASFREKEDLVEAWFDRADQAMLAETEQPDFLLQTTRRVLERLLQGAESIAGFLPCEPRVKAAFGDQVSAANDSVVSVN